MVHAQHGRHSWTHRIRRSLTVTVTALALAGTGLTANPASAASDAAVDSGSRQYSADNGTARPSPAISAAPYMVHLFYLDPSEQLWFCNGALIAPNRVLTAAQCVYGRTLTNRDKAVILRGTSYTTWPCSPSTARCPTPRSGPPPRATARCTPPGSTPPSTAGA